MRREAWFLITSFISIKYLVYATAMYWKCMHIPTERGIISILWKVEKKNMFDS